MKTTYLELCTYFMGGDVINEISDDIVKTIRLNTNIIDDKESTMGIHHDIPTPTPAMATGSTNYRFEDGEWTLKQRFSIIMFSVYKRTAMKSHGYNRK